MFQLKSTENKLLAALPEEESERLEEQLTVVHLSRGQILYGVGDPVKHLYFPINCVISVVTSLSDGATVEVTMTGREGVTGIDSIFDSFAARHWNRVLFPGEALKLKSETLKEAFTRSEAVQRVMMGYYRSLITLISQRAACNGRHTIMQRLCCWLLMAHDRLGSDEFPLTQEEMASKLGVRRAGVTQAARSLLDSGAVNYNHGRVRVLNRRALESLACECYRVCAEEFYGGKAGGAGAGPRQPADEL